MQHSFTEVADGATQESVVRHIEALCTGVARGLFAKDDKYRKACSQVLVPELLDCLQAMSTVRSSERGLPEKLFQTCSM